MFQISSETHRRGAIDVITARYAPDVRAIPVERNSSVETLPLIIAMDDTYLGRAVTAVLTVDPHARHPQ